MIFSLHSFLSDDSLLLVIGTTTEPQELDALGTY